MFTARLRALTRTLLLAGVLVAAVPAARAADAGGAVSPDGAVNAANYTACAGGLAIATTFPQAWTGLAFCLKILADEWNRTF